MTLNTYINRHRLLFDREPLPVGHEERFFRKRARQSGFRRRQLLGIAASLTFLLLASLTVWIFRTDAPGAHFAMSRERRIEAKMLQAYQNEINIIEQQLKHYASEIPPSDWEQIESTIEFLAQNRDLLSETLPPETPFPLRRAALEEYYSRNLSGMQQIADLLSQNL